MDVLEVVADTTIETKSFSSFCCCVMDLMDFPPIPLAVAEPFEYADEVVAVANQSKSKSSKLGCKGPNPG